MGSPPAYLALLESGELRRREQEAWRRLEACELCPRRCRARRLDDGRGAHCGTGRRAILHSFGPHHGEEAPLRGWRGSGTVFFAGCSLHCVYCQNCGISQARTGLEVDAEGLAAAMLDLQGRGCHNLNLVTPTHVVPQILAALRLAAGAGLRLPIVYNSGGYDAVDTLRLLDGVVDLYMPDLKYGDPASARRLSDAADYVEVNRAAVREMHRQVGDLVQDARGLAGTRAVLAFLAREISPDTYLNLMDQYRPCHRAADHPPLDRRLQRGEYREALRWAAEAGLRRLDGGR